MAHVLGSNEFAQRYQDFRRFRGRSRPRSRGDFAALTLSSTEQIEDPRPAPVVGFLFSRAGRFRVETPKNTMTLTQHHRTPGHDPAATAFMAARDLESHGFFLAPLLQPGFDVLDAGCGPGTITNDIAECIFPGRVTGLDISPGRIEHARRLSQGREIVNANFIQGSACEIPFEDSSFDLVFSHALLDYLREPQRVLREFHRVTRHGGFAAVCTPDWDMIRIDPCPGEVAEAIDAYRQLRANNGGNTQAGPLLGGWMADAGFTPISIGVWTEHHDSPRRIADHIAAQLGESGRKEALRAWASSPGAEFRQTWHYAVAVKFGHA